MYCITQEIRGGICKSQSAPSILGPRASSQLKQQSACVHPTVYFDMPLHSQLNSTQTQCEVSNTISVHVIQSKSIAGFTLLCAWEKTPFISGGQHQSWSL